MGLKSGRGSEDEASLSRPEPPEQLAEQQVQSRQDESTSIDPGVAAEIATPRRPALPSGTKHLVPATRTQRVIAALALAFLVGSVGYLVGVRTGDPGSPSAQSADIGFLFDMTVHHEQAIQLSLIELSRGTEPSVQAFAREILQSQSYEIGLMRMRLGTWGFDRDDRPQAPMAWMGMSLAAASDMPGMADDTEMTTIRAAEGADVDAMFLALMADHHAGGVAMAQAAADSASDAWVIDTATRMAQIQASEIFEMEYAREAAGLDPRPFGFSPDFGSKDASMDAMDMDSADDGG